MSDPRRLFESGTADERWLLASVDVDAPKSHARRALLVSLGVSAAAAATTTSAAAGGATSGGAGTGTTLTMILKWLGIGFTGGLITLGVASQLDAPGKHPQVVSPTKTAVERPTAPPGVAGVGETTVRGPGAKPPMGGRAAPRSGIAEDEPLRASGLGEEIRSLDRARAAVASGNATRGIALLDEHQRRFPNGSLGEEATILRIEALLALGQRDGARDLAARMLRENPESPHARRLRSLLGDQPRRHTRASEPGAATPQSAAIKSFPRAP